MNPAVLSISTISIPVLFMASFLIWFMFVGLIVLWYIDGPIHKEQVIHALVALILSWVITEVIKGLIPIPRPYMVNGSIPLTLSDHSDASFPSSHSAVAFSVAYTIWLHDKRSGMIYILMAVLVALGRVLSNVHYPIDVIVGSVIGLTVSGFLDRVHFHKFARKGQSHS